MAKTARKMKPQSSLEFDAFIAKQLNMSYGAYKATISEADRDKLETRFAAAFRKAARNAVGTAQAEGIKNIAR